MHDGNTGPMVGGRLTALRAIAIAIAMLGTCATARAADPPVAASAAASAASPEPAAPQTRDFFSSLKDAFGRDFTREVVIGHFDVGTPPDAHRFYCLVDTKTGKRETNGVAGTPKKRSDGMTGIGQAAVALYSCVDAERQGLLDTTGYVLSDAVRARMAPLASVPAFAPPTAAKPAAVGAATLPPAAQPAAAGTTTAGAAAVAGADLSGVRATFERFVAAQNAHDQAALGATLVDSPNVYWAPSGGQAVWGREALLTAFAAEWTHGTRLVPHIEAWRVGEPVAGVALAAVPIDVVSGPTAYGSSSLAVRWNGVFVNTAAGWRIAAIYLTGGARP